MDIADAERSFIQTANGEIFPHRAAGEAAGMAGKLCFPERVMRLGIAIDRLVGAAMHRQVSLRVTVQSVGRYARLRHAVLDEAAGYRLRPQWCDAANLNG